MLTIIMKRKKKKNNLGFTLVEIIVVLLILAILAAIMIPALFRYIDDAKNKQDVLDAKACFTAVQSQLAITYGTYKPDYTKNQDYNNIFAGMANTKVTDKNQNVFLFNGSKLSPFTQGVFEKSGLNKPYCIILYTIQITNLSAGGDTKGSYMAYSIVYWADKNRKPLYYDMNENDWKEGSPYTAGLVIRGSETSGTGKKANEIIKGKYTGEVVVPYIVYADASIANKTVTQINTLIKDALNK